MKGYGIFYKIEGIADRQYTKTLGINEDDAILNLKESLTEYDNLNLSIDVVFEIPLGSITLGELSIAEFNKYYK